MNVRRLEDGDEALLRDVRLRALAESPDAFDSTHASEAAHDDAAWSRWLASGATFAVEGTDGAVGLAAGVWHRDHPRRVLLISVWVRPDRRGTGVGDALVGAVLDWARNERAEGVWLHVVRDDARARRFYERLGFVETGVEIRRERDGVPEVEMWHSLELADRAEADPRSG